MSHRGGAIWQATAGYILGLGGVSKILDKDSVGLEELEGASGSGETESEVFRSGAFISPEALEVARSDEGMCSIAIDRFATCEVEIAQGDRMRAVLIVEFEPVSFSGNPVGDPFIDGELGGGSERDGEAIWGSGSWGGEDPVLAVLA